MTESDQLMWGSHLPALLACVGCTVGPVLELGVGDFSTPALHALCGSMERKLVSVESDRCWLETFRPKMETSDHHFVLGDYDFIVSMLADKHPWAVSFIDNSPGGDRRRNDFTSLLPVSQFVVLHDYHRENEEAIAPLLKVEGVHHYCSKLYQPPTLIASIKRTIPKAILI